MRTQVSFVRHIHYFRAFAIVNVVFAHLWALPENFAGTPAADWVDQTRELLFHGSTIYLLFISGFLFEHLSPTFSLKKYYKAKIIRVLSPYCFVTAALILLKIVFGSDPEYTFGTFFPALCRSLMTGELEVQFWYIPFILMVFAISPLLLWIPRGMFSVLVIWSACLPLLGTRTGTELTVLQFLYFLPVYLLGMYACRRYRDLKPYLRKAFYPLIAVVAVTTMLMASIDSEALRFGSFNLNESLHYLQKLAITFLVLGFLLRWEHTEVPLLDVLAEYSFAIYFLHEAIGDYPLIKNSIYSFFETGSPSVLFLLSVGYVFLAVFVTLAVCLFAKRVFGQYSRYLIGA